MRREGPSPGGARLSHRGLRFFYSVPHELIRQHVDTRATERGIEIFHQGKRVAVHQRRYGGTKHGTDIQHMPSAHRRYGEWTPERFRRWGATIGPNTEGLITAILESDIFTLIHF